MNKDLLEILDEGPVNILGGVLGFFTAICENKTLLDEEKINIIYSNCKELDVEIKKRIS